MPRQHPFPGAAPEWSPEQPPGSDGRLLRIGEVAEQVGLSLRTIRFYEEEGLVVPETRTSGGFRLYAPSAVARLEIIKRMKPLGFSVEEMREVMVALDALGEATAVEEHGPLAAALEAYRDRLTTACEDLVAKAARGQELALYLDGLARRRA